MKDLYCNHISKLFGETAWACFKVVRKSITNELQLKNVRIINIIKSVISFEGITYIAYTNTYRPGKLGTLQ